MKNNAYWNVIIQELVLTLIQDCYCKWKIMHIGMWLYRDYYIWSNLAGYRTQQPFLSRFKHSIALTFLSECPNELHWQFMIFSALYSLFCRTLWLELKLALHIPKINSALLFSLFLKVVLSLLHFCFNQSITTDPFLLQF